MSHRPANFRTKLCHHREDYCKHRDRHDCWFAHDVEELRCLAFAVDGNCADEACTLRHYNDKIDEVKVKDSVPPCTKEKPKYVRGLPQYAMPHELSEIVPKSPLDVPLQQQELARIAGAFIASHSKTVTDKLHAMQHVEECLKELDMRSFAVLGIRIRRAPGNTIKIPVRGLSESRPSLRRDDRVQLCDEKTSKWVEGYVLSVGLREVTICLPTTCHGESYYSVFFALSRTQERICHRAIDDSRLLLNRSRCYQKTTIPTKDLPPVVVTHPTTLNAEQLTFVQRVINKSSETVLVLWGPPGTGKTTAVVAAVTEVLARTPSNYRVLIMTSGNDAADLVTQRLADPKYCDVLNCDGISLMLRFNAAGRAGKVHEDILKFSLPSQDGDFVYPTVESLVRYRVVVATLSTANQLYALGVSENFFGHVFVDEAGHTTEAELLVGLQAAPKALRIVLAGDHKQLGPLVRSQCCIDAGMGVSPLQRLQKENDLSVMLRLNYRSDSRIVRLVNVAYDDMLLSGRQRPPTMNCGVIPVTFKERQYLLPITDNAVVFIHHTERESREYDSPSWQNTGEAHLCIDLSHSLHEKTGIPLRDMVVLSPYLKQVVRMHEQLHEKSSSYPLSASTLEMFQGREHRVVFLSSVRNNDTDEQFSLGFLREPQRANVAVSRARDLLVVVGNLRLMGRDEVWEKYIARAAEVGALWDFARPPRPDGTPWGWGPQAQPPQCAPLPPLPVGMRDYELQDFCRPMHRDE